MLRFRVARLQGAYYVDMQEVELPTIKECISEEEVALHLNRKLKLSRRLELFAHTADCPRCAVRINTYPWSERVVIPELLSLAAQILTGGYTFQQITLPKTATPLLQ